MFGNYAKALHVAGFVDCRLRARCPAIRRITPSARPIPAAIRLDVTASSTRPVIHGPNRNASQRRTESRPPRNRRRGANVSWRITYARSRRQLISLPANHVAGFAINFLLYTLSGRVFREQLVAILCRGCGRGGRCGGDGGGGGGSPSTLGYARSRAPAVTTNAIQGKLSAICTTV